MGCCGDKRKAATLRRTIAATPKPSPLQASTRVPLLFLGTGAYLVSGPRSRLVYRFSDDEPEQLVEARDAPALVRTGLFRARPGANPGSKTSNPEWSGR
jgi:hypothetical protein